MTTLTEAQAAHALVGTYLASLSPPATTEPPVIIPPTGTSIANRAALDKALASARGGETFALADSDYGMFDFRDRLFDERVTVQGSRGVRFREANKAALKPRNLRNMTFRGITISGNGGFNDGYAVLDLANTDGLTFDDIMLANTDASGFGIFMRGGSNNRNFKFINSEVTALKYFAVIQSGVNILIKGNDSHHLRNDHIQLSGTTNVTIEGNIFRDTKLVAGDHADIIQMTGPTTNTIIRHNTASGVSQGICSHSEKNFQENLLIEGNDLNMQVYTNIIRVLAGSGRVTDNKTTLTDAASPGTIRADGAFVRTGNTVNGKLYP